MLNIGTSILSSPIIVHIVFYRYWSLVLLYNDSPV